MASLVASPAQVHILSPPAADENRLIHYLVVATITSLLIWYIVDGKIPGVIVLLFVFTFLEFYFIIKFPRFIVIAILSIVTQVLIVGYELQVRKVGEQVGLTIVKIKEG